MSKMPDYCNLNSIKSKIKADDDKKIRGLSFAKLFFANKDYEKSLTYLNEYLSIKSNSPEAYKVLGDVYAALGNDEKSVEAYKKSYFIDKNQDNLLIKICEKLENLNNIDTQTIKLWLGRLEKKYPNHQSVFNLKDKLQLENGNSSRLEDTFRDLSNVKLTDLTDDNKGGNLSSSFLNTRNQSPALQSSAVTPGHFKSLERNQDRLFKKLIEMEENFNQTNNQILELVKENQTIFKQLKNEVDKVNITLGKLQLGQNEIKESIEMHLNNDDYVNEDEEDEGEEYEDDFIDPCLNENNPQLNLSAPFLSCNSTNNQQQNTSDVFSRLGKDSANNSFNRSSTFSQQSPFTPNNPTASLNQPSVPTPVSQLKPIQPPVFGTPASVNKSPLEQMSAAISKIGLNTSTPAVVTSVGTSTALSTTATLPQKTIDQSQKPLSELYKDQFKGKWKCDTCYCVNELNSTSCISCETPKPGSTQPSQQASTLSSAISRPFSFNPVSTSSGFSFTQTFNQVSPQNKQQTPQIPAPVLNSSAISISTSTDSNKFCFGVPQPQQQQPAINLPSNFQFPQKSSVEPSAFASSGIFGGSNSISNQTLQAPNAQFPATLFSPSKQATPAFASSLNSDSFVFGSIQSSSQSNIKAPSVFGNILSSSGNKAIVSPVTTDKSNDENRAIRDERAIADGEDEPQIDFKPVIPLPPKVDVYTGEENEEVVYQHRAKLYRYAGNEWKERGLGDIKILHDKENKRYRLLMRREQIHKVCLNTPILPTFEFQKTTNAAGNMLQFGCCDFSDGELGKAEVLALKFKLKETADRFKSEVCTIVSILAGNSNTTVNTSEECSNKDTPLTQSESDEIEVIYVKEPQSSEEREKAVKLKLPLNFFSYTRSDRKCAGCYGCDDYIPKLRYELSSGDDKENVKEPSKQETNTNSASLVSSSAADSNSENLFSSAALANVAKSTWTKSTEQPNWLKSAPLFQSQVTQTGDGANDDPEKEIATLDFKPVIALPDLVELTTGEEDEEVLFSSRAKLYKFTGNEWKERGLGEFKVLKHKQTEKIRFLMRREQVHKICLNHLVDKSLKIGKRKERDTIYQWGATDFSDDPSGTPSNFNLKFKNKEIGLQFIETLKQNVEGFNETIF